MTKSSDKFNELRQRAEKLLVPSEESIISDSVSQSITEVRNTIHELYTYRIELELQNDELLKTQSQLQTVSQDYLDFYKYAPVAYVTLNNASSIIKANNALENILGLSMQQLLKQPFTHYVLASDQDSLYLYKQALQDHQQPPACELRLLNQNGQIIWVNCQGVCKEESASGEINFILTDITERKKAEQALQELLSHQENALEDHKAKIEQEIHDLVGSNLIGLKMELSSLRKQLPVELANCHEKCAVMNGQLDVLVQTIMHITTELRPCILDQLGLLAAIDEKMKDFRLLTDIRCDVSLPEKPVEVDFYRDIAVFRILEEALTNIAMHSGANHVRVEVTVGNDSMVMKIIDNGCGMTDAQMRAPGKYGILGMQTRARNLGGELAIDSHVEEGVTLVLSMPLKSVESRE